MKSFYITILAVIFSCSIAQVALAQALSGMDAQTNINTLGNNDLNGIVRKFDTRYQGIMGSPFLFNYWNTGSITLANGKLITNVPLKIDLYGNQVIAKRQSGDSIIVNSNTIQKVLLTDVITGKKYAFHKLSTLTGQNSSLQEIYVDVLHEGKYILVAERKKKLVKADYEGAYSTGKAYDEFINEASYFVKKPDQSMDKIKLTKKSIIDLFPDHQQALKSFIAKESIDFKNEGQVAQIFQYYETL